MPRHRGNSKSTGSSAPGFTPRLSAALASDDMMSRRTELVLRELEQLPTLPAVATRLLQLGANDEAEVKELVRLIESDPALTVRLLSLCKRAAHRTRLPITTVEMAVVMLGLEAVRSLVLSVEIFDWSGQMQAAARRGDGTPPERTARGRSSTKPGSDPARPAGQGFNRIGFWQHSIAVACCCDLIAREHADLDFHPEEAFVCGLVHDMGKLALELVLPRAYSRVVDLAEQRQGNIADFERPIVGLDHHAAGLRLAERWGLPPMLRQAMGYHHLEVEQIPEDANQRLVGLVGLSDLICRRLSLGWSGNFTVEADERAIAESLGLDPDRIANITPRLYEATSARMRDLGLGDEPSQQLLIESILRANQRLGRANQDLIRANLALETAQQQLTEARALARLGQMTAGAAHEMNNPLTVISGRAQGLLPRLRDEQDRAAARSIVDACGRLTGLISRLHRIATPPQPSVRVVDLRELLEHIITQAKDRYGERVQARGERLTVIGVKLTAPEGIEPARIDPDMLADALIEIIVNALEAGPRGRVEVRVEPDPSDDRLRIQVIDDGTGMSQLALSHALDPFFSEKPAGRQSGLGLALAHRLIASQDGQIDLASKPGRGTTVTVLLNNWRAGKDARVNYKAAA